MYTKERIQEITTLVLDNIGVDITDPDFADQMDSLQYINAVVDLESAFDIEFPDEILTRNIFQYLDDLFDMLVSLLGNQCQ